MDFRSPLSATGVSSMPFARACITTPHFPRCVRMRWRFASARSPAVTIPSDVSRSSAFFPIPGIFLTGRGARNAAASSGRTMVIPSGFWKSDAIFAIVLFGPIPTEQVIPWWDLTIFLISLPNVSAEVYDPHEEISQYASSTLTWAKISANGLMFSIMSAETLQYSVWLTGR